MDLIYDYKEEIKNLYQKNNKMFYVEKFQMKRLIEIEVKNEDKCTKRSIPSEIVSCAHGSEWTPPSLALLTPEFLFFTVLISVLSLSLSL